MPAPTRRSRRFASVKAEQEPEPVTEAELDISGIKQEDSFPEPKKVSRVSSTDTTDSGSMEPPLKKRRGRPPKTKFDSFDDGVDSSPCTSITELIDSPVTSVSADPEIPLEEEKEEVRPCEEEINVNNQLTTNHILENPTVLVDVKDEFDKETSTSRPVEMTNLAKNARLQVNLTRINMSVTEGDVKEEGEPMKIEKPEEDIPEMIVRVMPKEDNTPDHVGVQSIKNDYSIQDKGTETHFPHEPVTADQFFQDPEVIEDVETVKAIRDFDEEKSCSNAVVVNFLSDLVSSIPK